MASYVQLRHPTLRPARALSRSLRAWLTTTPGRPVRRRLARGESEWARRLPPFVRRKLDIDGDVVAPLRVELGAGSFPMPGYVHVDKWPRARHLEYVAPVWDLPFSDGVVAEILAIHVLEHVHPGDLRRTLREWSRVLAPGAAAQIHVPNAGEILPRFLRGSISEKWGLMNAIFGMYGSASVVSPDALDPRVNAADHKVIFDFALLDSELRECGFDRIDEVTATTQDRHTEAWGFPFSLVVRAYTPESPSTSAP